MYIVRDGKKIELTTDELLQAQEICVKNFMANIIIQDFGVVEDKAKDFADMAYDMYAKGNGETQYECIEKVMDEVGIELTTQIK